MYIVLTAWATSTHAGQAEWIKLLALATLCKLLEEERVDAFKQASLNWAAVAAVG